MHTSHARPEPVSQSKFETSNSGGLDPHLTSEQASDQSMVNSCLSSDRTNTPVTNNLGQVHGDNAQVLSDWVGAGSVGPVGTALAGSGAGRPRHESTLGEQENSQSTRQAFDLEVRSTPIGDNYPHLVEEVRARIMHYTPQIPAAEWDPIADFVRHAVAQAGPTRVDTAKNWLNAVAMLTHFCHHVACMDLTVEAVFHSDSIERFVQQMASTNRSTKATYRARLFAVAEELVGHQNQSHLRSEISRWEPADAYTPSELDSLRFTQRTQRTSYRMEQVGVLMGLGLGGGLTSGEMLRLRRSDVTLSDGVVVVHILGNQRRHSRLVPVLHDWESFLAPALGDSNAEGMVILPRRTTNNPGTIASFISTCARQGLVPNMWRMRATWIVSHLNAGTPLPDLTEAAGIESLTKFERFLPHLDRLPDESRLVRMRNIGGAR